MVAKEPAEAPPGDVVMAASGDDAVEQLGLTREFVEAMMAHFKAQKKLPLRYVLQILLDFQVRSCCLIHGDAGWFLSMAHHE